MCSFGLMNLLCAVSPFIVLVEMSQGYLQAVVKKQLRSEEVNEFAGCIGVGVSTDLPFVVEM